MLPDHPGRSIGAVLSALVIVTGLVACGSGESSGRGGEKVTVFAAASLTEAFSEIGRQFERENAGTEVEFSFGASSDLAGQIDQGAPAEVFASADEVNMQKVVESGMNGDEPVAFAGNVLEIVVPIGNPAEVSSLEDLSDEDLLVAVCDVEVPCGNAASRVFSKVGLEPAIDSYEPDVRAVLTKVELGEVDAGLVYHSDVLAAGDRIQPIRIPEAFEVVNRYPIVTIKGSGGTEGATDFIDLVLSDAGRSVLKRWGFREP